MGDEVELARQAVGGVEQRLDGGGLEQRQRTAGMLLLNYQDHHQQNFGRYGHSDWFADPYDTGIVACRTDKTGSVAGVPKTAAGGRTVPPRGLGAHERVVNARGETSGSGLIFTQNR